MKNVEREKLHSAYSHFLDMRESFQSPSEFPLSYDLCKLIGEKKWKSVPFIEIKISTELQETINKLNYWLYNLKNWEVWLNVLEKYNEDDRWLISYNFIENIAFYCMLQPSAIRDLFGLIATNSIHYTNLSIDPQYKDFLDQDKKRNPDIPPKRSECEQQLNRLGKNFSSFITFEQRLQEMDSEKYRENTCNFRNLSSHRIAPRFEIGHTDFIKRSIVPKSELVQQSDGSFHLIEDPTNKVVSYGIGWTLPLDFRKTQEINKEECMLAISTLKAYQDLLKELLSNLQSQ